MVDDDDYELLSKYRWCVTSSKSKILYALRGVNGSTRKMHREIMGVTDPRIFVDHIDGNGLNNQKNNLRLATNSQNNCNRIAKKNGSSKYLGVSLCRKNGLWCAQIRRNGRTIRLGYFKQEVQAAICYNEQAPLYHGEFARLNNIDL